MNTTNSPKFATACAHYAPSFPVNIGASSIATAPIRPSLSTALTEAGYLAALIPEEYGGSGLSLGAAAAILEEMHASGCNGAACHAQMYTMGTILRHGSAEQKERYLPLIASGELRLQAFGVTEPTSGTDTLSLRTTARARRQRSLRHQRPEDLDLARRTFRSDAAARAHDAARAGQEAHRGLSVFLVDMRLGARHQASTINPIRTMMNHATTEVFFDELRVPAENLIGEEGQGFRYILSGMNAERILIAAECIGDAKWFIDKATAYAKERELFGRPIGQNQGVQFPIARAYAQMRAAELMVHEAARAIRSRRGHAAPRPTWRSCSPPTRHGRPPTCACRPTAASALPRNSTSSANSARRGSITVAPISTNLILSYLAEHVLGLPRSY